MFHVFTQLPIYLLNYSSISSTTHILLIYPTIYLITHIFTQLPINLLNYPFTYSITHLFTESEECKYPDIKVTDFLQHVQDLHANSDDGFSMQFDEIGAQTRTDLPAEHSDLPENKNKNRYVNISACKYTHTQVVCLWINLTIKRFKYHQK